MLLVAMDQRELLYNLVIRLADVYTRLCMSLRTAHPGLVIQTCHVDHQRIPLPVTDGMPQIGGVEIFRVRSSIRVHDAESLADKIRLVEQHDHFRSLNDLQWPRRDARDSAWQAVKVRIFRCSFSILVIDDGF